MTDRLFSLLLALMALLYGLSAHQIRVPFAYDPLGPKPLPLTLAALLLLLASILFCCPLDTSDQKTKQRAVLHLLTILVFYQVAWTYLGFLLATTISLYFLSRLFLCSWMEGLMTSLVLSVTCYGLFHFILEIPLPLGALFSYSGG